MNTENLNITVTGDKPAELIIREGAALPLKEPKIIDINGILKNPLEWLKKRNSEIDGLQAHIIVNREKMSIVLVTEESNHYSKKVGGSLQLHPDFLKFGINSGEYVTAFDMAHFFKMNRSCFENQSEAMNLVATLQNFKAKVNKELENSDNNRLPPVFFTSRKIPSPVSILISPLKAAKRGCDKAPGQKTLISS